VEARLVQDAVLDESTARKPVRRLGAEVVEEMTRRVVGQVLGTGRGFLEATRVNPSHTSKKAASPRSKRVDLGGARSSVTTPEHTGSAETGL
jgi:hypothetical protein